MPNITLTDKVKEELKKLKIETGSHTYNDVVNLLIREYKIRREYEKKRDQTPSDTA